MKLKGELRRGPDGDRNAGERRYDPTTEPRGDGDVQSNWDNFNVPAGATQVLMDVERPGVITHIWITFSVIVEGGDSYNAFRRMPFRY